MPRKKTEKYISDLLNIENDILPNGITAIWSGVGSGKNTLIEGKHEKVVCEDGTTKEINITGLIENYRVLLITSRKSKVIETNESHKPKDGRDETVTPFIMNITHNGDCYNDDRNKNVICTSAHIKTIIKNGWEPSSTPFWQDFDFVVIDEFHSLISDATFSDTAYIMKCFIDEVYKDCIRDRRPETIKTKMIFMSGTPHTTIKLLQDFTVKEYNLLEKAKYIKPKRINFTHYMAVIETMRTVLKRDGTVVYYMCQLDKLTKLIDTARSIGLNDAQIAVSVSDDKTNKDLSINYNVIFENKERIEKYLSEYNAIPNDIKLFITNTKNKEGINIETIPNLLILEHHYQDDIIQICGRFRKGIKDVKILYDAKQFSLPVSYFREEEYQREEGVNGANKFFQKLVEKNEVDLSYMTAYNNNELNSFIEYIEKSTPFVKFNPFKNKFELNNCYIQAKEDYFAGQASFKRLMTDFEQRQVMILSGFYEGINVTYTPIEDPSDWIEKYFIKNGFVFNETIFASKHEKKLLRDLNNFRSRQPNANSTKYRNLGALIKYFGCKKKPYGRTENKMFTINK